MTLPETPALVPAPGSLAAFRAAEAVRRRRSLLCGALAAALAFLAFLVPSQRPPWAEEAARRFGLAGPTQLVTEIQLERPRDAEAGRPGRLPAMETVELPRRATSPAATARVRGPAPGEPRPPELTVEGESGGSLRRADLPVVQSEDLVIETLVRPAYPHEARVQGLEAVVEAVALVDERGRVREVEIVSNTGHEMFAIAARDAVRRCHFQPYLRDGKPSPVFARFRFNFKLI